MITYLIMFVVTPFSAFTIGEYGWHSSGNTSWSPALLFPRAAAALGWRDGNSLPLVGGKQPLVSSMAWSIHHLVSICFDDSPISRISHGFFPSDLHFLPEKTLGRSINPITNEVPRLRLVWLQTVKGPGWLLVWNCDDENIWKLVE